MIYYIIFALTTAIHAMFSIVYPVLNKGKLEGMNTENTMITYITFFVIIALVAPIIIMSCIVPSMTERFKIALYEGIFSKD
jgi:hypothetical protein